MWLNYNCKYRKLFGCDKQPVEQHRCTGEKLVTTFGQRLRELRKEHDFSQKALAELIGINFTYLSKIENERLDFAQFPSEDLICKLATALKSDEDELLILAKKVPSKIKERVFERPEVFAALADCDDKTLDKFMSLIGEGRPRRKKTKPA